MPRWSCLDAPAVPASCRASLFALLAGLGAACAGPAAPTVPVNSGVFVLTDTKAGPKEVAGSDAAAELADAEAQDAADPVDTEPVPDIGPLADSDPVVDAATLDVADAAPDAKPDVKPDVPDVKPDAPDTKPDAKDVKDTTPDVPPPPTFAEVWTQVINAPVYGCAAMKCHGTKPDSPGLDLFTSQATAYDRLINKPGKFIGCKSKILVVPGDPDASVLYTKVAPDVDVTCGVKMPEAVDSTGILQADADLIKAWILAGAKP